MGTTLIIIYKQFKNNQVLRYLRCIFKHTLSVSIHKYDEIKFVSGLDFEPYKFYLFLIDFTWCKK